MCIATYKEFFICAIRVIFVSLKWIREHFWFYCGHLKKACDVCLAGSGVSLQRPDSQALTSLCCSINWLPSLGNYWIRLWGFCPLQLLILEKGPPGHVGFPACERHFHSNPCPLAVIHCGPAGPFQGVLLTLTTAWAMTEQELRWWDLVVSTATVLGRGGCPQAHFHMLIIVC